MCLTNKYFRLGVLSILIAFLASGCSHSDNHRGVPNLHKSERLDSLSVNYFVENSASNFGYVNGNTNYVDVVSELAQKQAFVSDTNIKQNFNFINGVNKLKRTPEGTDPSNFTSKLNPHDMKVGDIKGDDLNKMFQYVLSKADTNSISIFISDAIYDINKKKYPTKALDIQGKETRSKFVSRIKNEKIETLVIKLKSEFHGIYYYGVKPGKIKIDQERPFYIFIFGKPSMVNKYFTEKYIKHYLNGFKNFARFFNSNGVKVQYQSTSYKGKGSFRPVRGKPHVIKDVTSRKGIFQFTIGVNFSSIPLSKLFLADKKNYKVSKKYRIVSITSDSTINTNITDFKPTDFITLRTDKNPIGHLEIKLKNMAPSWIAKTGIKDDSNIKGDTNHTFGFENLMIGITQAYKHTVGQSYLFKMNIKLQR